MKWPALSPVSSLAMVAVSTLTVLATGCADKPGEDRPGITILNGVDGNVSVSAVDPPPTPAPTIGPPQIYFLETDVQPQANIALDVRDMLAIVAPAAGGGAVDWAAVAAIYENGRYSKTVASALRSLSGMAMATHPSAHAAIDAALKGTGASAGASDIARVEAVRAGTLAVVRAQVLTELAAARARLADGKGSEAVAAVDAAWAFYAGATDETGGRPFLLLAMSRRGQPQSQLDDSIQKAMAGMQGAAKRGDLAAFDRAHADALNGLGEVL